MLIGRGVPLLVCVVLVVGGGCVWRPQPRVQPDALLSIPELQMRATAAEASVRAASNRVDLAGRAIENAVAVRSDAEAIFLTALSSRDVTGLELVVKRVEASHSDAADAFRLAIRLVAGCRRLASSGDELQAAMRDAGGDTIVVAVSRSERERLRRAVLDVESALRDLDIVTDEIKARWLVRLGPSVPESARQSLPVGTVERELSVGKAQATGE